MKTPEQEPVRLHGAARSSLITSTEPPAWPVAVPKENSMQPTIGRIVHYTLSEQDVALIDQQIPASDENRVYRNSVRAGDVYPAMIVQVWGDTPGSSVNLQVFLDGACSWWATSRTEGDGEFHWAWPPRV